ncbi:MAG: type II toxin-antitoxin system RelE/ParE family toxin [Bacillota bacterium]|nr:type II toxin-antitoxin system RelE/ParE family toxin [Bacillota bacterium]
MYILYFDKKIQRLCNDYKYAKKKLPLKIADKLFQTINFIENSSSLNTLIKYKPFNFHDLKGNRLGQYAIDIGSRRDGYRLIVKFNESKEEVFKNSIEITEIIVKEMGNHYD